MFLAVWLILLSAGSISAKNSSSTWYLRWRVPEVPVKTSDEGLRSSWRPSLGTSGTEMVR